jgi:chemotaxis-related protein WspD
MNDARPDQAKLLEIDEPSQDAILRLLDKPLAEDDLRDATARVAQPLEQAEKDVVRLLVFQMGSELMALPSVQVKQVTRATRVHRIPHRTNKLIRGLCNLDSELMLCADLAQLLELPAAAGETAANVLHQRRMIVLGEPAQRWVVEVDAVRGVTTVPRSAFRRPPMTADAGLADYTTALVSLGESLAAVLDVDRVLTDFQAALR